MSRAPTSLAVAAALVCLHAQAQDTQWVKKVDQYKSFVLPAVGHTRFGTGSAWVYRDFGGSAASIPCTSAFYGLDPAPGKAKQCDVSMVVATPAPAPALPASAASAVCSCAPAPSPPASAAPAPVPAPPASAPAPSPAPAPAPTAGPAIPPGLPVDPTSVIGPQPVYSSTFPNPYNGGRQSPMLVNQPGTLRPGDGTGQFRTVCGPSNAGWVDPIVAPRQPNNSHLHVFFGVPVNENTTTDMAPTSIFKAAGTTCRGGMAINASAYWTPGMVDLRTNKMMAPHHAHEYYKTGYSIDPNVAFKSIPRGLRMIAGNSGSTAPQGVVTYKCEGSGTQAFSSIPSCKAGDELWVNVFFPQCWDGRNLDPPDHKSHMSYPVNRQCPEAFPVPLPELSQHVVYEVTADGQTANWALASDVYLKTSPTMPKGYSGHADYMAGWADDAMQSIVTNCLRAKVDCGSDNLGDGRSIAGPF